MGHVIGFDITAEVRRVAQQAVIPAVDETSAAMAHVAATVAHKRTGRLAAGWHANPAQLITPTLVRGGIENDVAYALYQDKGTSEDPPENMSGIAIDTEAPYLPGRIRARL